MSITNKTRIYLIATLLFIIAGIPAYGTPTAGQHMLQLSGGVFMAQGDADTGTAQFELAYGYMLFPRWEIGARQLASYSLNDPVEDVWTGSTTAMVNFYPLSENRNWRLQPFIGGFGGVGYSDVDLTGVAGPSVGVKYFFNDLAYFTLQWRYELYMRQLDAGNETTFRNDANMVFTLGIGLKWGGK